MRGVLVAVVLMARLAHAVGPPASPSLLLADCGRGGHTREYVATLDDRLVLARGFLDPALSEEETIRLAVRQKTLYFFGYFRNSTSEWRRDVIVSAEPPVVTIKRRAESTYGRDLTLDWTPTDTLKITDPYTSRA